MLSRCFLDFSVGVGAFVIGLSQSLPFSLNINGNVMYGNGIPWSILFKMMNIVVSAIT